MMQMTRDEDKFTASNGPDGQEDEDFALRMWRRFQQVRQAEGDNRSLMKRDDDMYDGYQWDEGIKQKMEGAGKPALTINIVKPTIDLVLGQERANRTQPDAKPRGPADVDGAHAITELLKYIMDQCRGDTEISAAFSDAVRAGIGWVEVDIRRRDDLRDDMANGFEDEPYIRHVRRDLVFVDPNSRRNDLSDARWIQRVMWLDEDEATALVPEKAEEIRTLLSDEAEIEDDNANDKAADPAGDVFEGVEKWGRSSWVDNRRRRILVLETQYRCIEDVQMVVTDEGAVEFDQRNQDHMMRAMMTPDEDLATLFPTVKRKRVRVALTCGPVKLSDGVMDKKHGRFTLVPIYAYRDGKGNPYGLIRQLVDSQMDYNKRRSASLLLLVAKRVLFETGAVKNIQYLREQANNPNAIIEFEEGALRNGTVRFERDADLVSGHVNLMQMAEAEIKSVSGINNEMRGMGGSDQSGRAIIARQQQGNMILTPLIDNLRDFRLRVFEMVGSLAQQFITEPRLIYITEAQAGREWLEINTPGAADISKAKVNFSMAEAPSTPTTRAEQFEQLLEFLRNMPPQISAVLIPEVIEASDLKNRQQIKGKAEMALVMSGLMPQQMLSPAPGMPAGGMPPPGMPMQPPGPPMQGPPMQPPM